MDVELSSLRGAPLLLFRGEIGNECAPQLREAVEDALRQRADQLLLDFKAVSYVDGGCLGLVWGHLRERPPTGPGWGLSARTRTSSAS